MIIQLVPIVGQFILFGYGLAASHRLLNGDTTLPPLQWWQHFRHGATFALIGLLYFTPVLGLIPNVAMIYGGLALVGLSPTPGTLAAMLLNVGIGLVLAGLSLVIWVGLCIGGVRYVQSNARIRVLLSANRHAKFVFAQRRRGLLLIFVVGFGWLLTLVLASLGTIFLLIPGAMMLVWGWLSISYYIAAFVGRHEETPPNVEPANMVTVRTTD